jgi:hypothetical protein
MGYDTKYVHSEKGNQLLVHNRERKHGEFRTSYYLARSFDVLKEGKY